MVKLLVVTGGGALGSAVRYLLGNYIMAQVGAGFPWATFAVNISGSFLIGVVLGLFESGALSNEARLLLAVGFLGGYTTFSTFSHETLKLLSSGAVGSVLLNTVGQLCVGLIAVYLGAVLARSLT